MRNLSLVLLTLFCLTICGLSQSPKQNAADSDIRISKDNPSVYITFERFGKAINPKDSKIAETDKSSKSIEKGDDVWLRLHNNTRWSIVFPTWSFYLGKLAVPYRPSEGSSYQLRDGMEVNAIYRVVDMDDRRMFNGPDSFSYSWLPSGRSVLFSVDRSHLSRGRNICLSFIYEWEMNDRGFPRSEEPSHETKYEISQLPEK